MKGDIDEKKHFIKRQLRFGERKATMDRKMCHEGVSMEELTEELGGCSSAITKAIQKLESQDRK